LYLKESEIEEAKRVKTNFEKWKNFTT
jgi:hypothetical protein